MTYKLLLPLFIIYLLKIKQHQVRERYFFGSHRIHAIELKNRKYSNLDYLLFQDVSTWQPSVGVAWIRRRWNGSCRRHHVRSVSLNSLSSFYAVVANVVDVVRRGHTGTAAEGAYWDSCGDRKRRCSACCSWWMLFSASLLVMMMLLLLLLMLPCRCWCFWCWCCWFGCWNCFFCSRRRRCRRCCCCCCWWCGNVVVVVISAVDVVVVVVIVFVVVVGVVVVGGVVVMLLLYLYCCCCYRRRCRCHRRCCCRCCCCRCCCCGAAALFICWSVSCLQAHPRLYILTYSLTVNYWWSNSLFDRNKETLIDTLAESSLFDQRQPLNDPHKSSYLYYYPATPGENKCDGPNSSWAN